MVGEMMLVVHVVSPMPERASRDPMMDTAYITSPASCQSRAMQILSGEVYVDKVMVRGTSNAAKAPWRDRDSLAMCMLCGDSARFDLVSVAHAHKVLR
jgi:hypothetical protein